MTTPVPCDLTCEFDLYTEEKMEGKEQFTFISQTIGEAKIKLRIPEAGIYHLKIFSLDTKGEMEELPLLYNYIIEASHPKENYLPFPETSSDWPVGSKLLEPTNGILLANTLVTVTVKVPHAEQVAVIAEPSKPFIHLEKSDDAMWHGDVTTGNGDDDFKVAAAFSTGSDSFSPLLVYQVG